MNTYQELVFICAFVFFTACSGNKPVRNEVIIHELGDPETLNPVNFTDATSGYITSHIFQKLIESDYKNPDRLVPVLAESLPQTERISDTSMALTFRIRNEARWDNGEPVTARDVEFTLKAIKCPLTNNPNAKPYFDFITDFKFYDNDSKKFTVFSDRIYFLAEATFTNIPILPEYMYDPKQLMRNFTVKQIAEEKDKLNTHPTMKEFTDDFNSEKRIRDTAFISGSGPYRFREWKTNESITLVKKKNWWGDALEKENCFFEAYPDKLIFRFISDQTTAIASLKAGNLDVMRTIRSKDFAELPKSEKFVQNFNAYQPMMYAYAYIGINTKSKFLSDKLVRQALAYLVDADKMIQTVKYGQAERVIGPIHPSKKKDYHRGITPYSYNPEKAKKLLKQAGWENTNGDETLDKIIGGKHHEFVLDFYINSESDERRAIALIVQEEAKKVGIKINIIANDFIVYIGKCRRHEFDLMFGLWVGGPAPDDLKQIYHTTAANGEGSNYYNFSNPEADSLMETLQSELNEEKRSQKYMRLQEILHEEVPVIFLWAPTERIAISKRFDNAYPSVIRPGYWVNGFKIRQ